MPFDWRAQGGALALPVRLRRPTEQPEQCRSSKGARSGGRAQHALQAGMGLGPFAATAGPARPSFPSGSIARCQIAIMASAVAASVAAARPVVAQRSAGKPRVAAVAGFKAPLAAKKQSFAGKVAQRLSAVQVRRTGGVAGPRACGQPRWGRSRAHRDPQTQCVMSPGRRAPAPAWWPPWPRSRVRWGRDLRLWNRRGTRTAPISRRRAAPRHGPAAAGAGLCGGRALAPALGADAPAPAPASRACSGRPVQG